MPSVLSESVFNPRLNTLNLLAFLLKILAREVREMFHQFPFVIEPMDHAFE